MNDVKEAISNEIFSSQESKIYIKHTLPLIVLICMSALIFGGLLGWLII